MSRTMSSVGPVVATEQVVAALSAATDGATVMPSGQSYGGSGIIVAVPEHSMVLTTAWPDDETNRVAWWVRRVSAAVTNAQTLRPRAFGAWQNDGVLYLDVVEIFPDDEEAAAVAAGRARNQIAVWHAGRGEEIATGGTGETLEDYGLTHPNWS